MGVAIGDATSIVGVGVGGSEMVGLFGRFV